MTCVEVCWHALPVSYRYFITGKEKQEIFTAKSQRDATPFVPFCVPGVFGPAPGGAPLGPEESGTGVDGGPAADGAAAPTGGDESILFDDDGETDKVDKNFHFDWAAYRAQWQDTPVDVAVTAMFAEYARLYARMSRLATSSVPAPMSMAEGISLGEQATNFVNKFITPILGKVTSTKVHKLLCHVAEAVRLHGNLRNCNTDSNESGHKADKPFYMRTNGALVTFTQQLVRQSHGTRAQLSKLQKEDAAAVAAHRAKLAERAACASAAASTAATAASVAAAAAAAAADDDDSSDDGAAAAAADKTREDAALAAAASAAATAALVSARGGVQGGSGSGVSTRGAAPSKMKKPYHLELISVGELAKRPGLGGAAAALRVSEDVRVRLVKRHRISARFDDGTETKQMVRADPNYRGAPWFDAVLFHAPASPNTPRLGELRAIVRRADGDWGLLSLLKPLPHDSQCPLVSRGCIRLQWHVREVGANVTLCAVPMSAVRRLAHIVPDFKDLAERRGYDALPADVGAPLEERVAMRYFFNAFCTWDV